MRHLLAFLIFFVGTAAADEFDPYKGPSPVLVLLTANPWLTVIGSDSPRLVAYDDGTIIYTRVQNKVASLWTTKLAPEKLAQLMDLVRPLLQLPDLKRHYNLAPYVTDQPTTSLFVADEGVVKALSVYGLSASGRSQREKSDGEEPPPAEFMKAHKSLCDYVAQDVRPWVPTYIEVMLWDYSYAPDASIIWPSKWPKLDSPRCCKRDNSYSVYLDGTEIQALREFIATRKEKGAVEIDGKKFAIDFRLAFPSEPVWMEAFSK